MVMVGTVGSMALVHAEEPGGHSAQQSRSVPNPPLSRRGWVAGPLTDFLRSIWAHEYETFKDSNEEKALIDRLKNWAARGVQKETSAQSAFIQEFFCATWGYVQNH